MSWFTEFRSWRSGSWSLVLRDDEFADITYDGQLVLRSVRAVIRNRDWDTAPLIVDSVRETDDAITLQVHSEALGSSFRGTVRAEARAGRLDILCDLESERSFETNRTGLVVLHPPVLSGAHLRVAHSDGSVEQTVFPREISAHQPALDIASLAWVDNGLDIDVTFSGDTFEMEDQRNWTDASFKTYSRALSLPFPYPVAAGERVRQSLSLQVNRTHAPTPDAPVDRIQLSPGGTFPAIGVGAATGPDPAPRYEPVGEVVLVELDLASTNWRAALDRARTAGVPLDVRFVLDPVNTDALIDGVAALAGIDVARVAAYQQAGDASHVSDSDAVLGLRNALGVAGLTIPVMGGSRSHFTELNREIHRIPADLDGLTVTMTPLFHALGTEQLVESVAMERLVARQSVAYAQGLPVHVGPVSLRPRFNNVATGPQPGPRGTDLAEGYGAEFTGGVDERQVAPELAAWTIASAAALAVPGVASLAWFEEWGERGIRNSAGEPLPSCAAVDALTQLRGDLLWGDSPDGLVWAIGANEGNLSTVLVANIGRDERTLTIGTPGGSITVMVAPASFTCRVIER